MDQSVKRKDFDARLIKLLNYKSRSTRNLNLRTFNNLKYCFLSSSLQLNSIYLIMSRSLTIPEQNLYHLQI